MDVAGEGSIGGGYGSSEQDPGVVPFNDVMKVISARAARHVFKSQQERAHVRTDHQLAYIYIRRDHSINE